MQACPQKRNCTENAPQCLKATGASVYSGGLTEAPTRCLPCSTPCTIQEGGCRHIIPTALFSPLSLIPPVPLSLFARASIPNLHPTHTPETSPAHGLGDRKQPFRMSQEHPSHHDKAPTGITVGALRSPHKMRRSAKEGLRARSLRSTRCLRGAGHARHAWSLRHTRSPGNARRTRNPRNTRRRSSFRTATRTLAEGRIDLRAALRALDGTRLNSWWSEAHRKNPFFRKSAHRNKDCRLAAVDRNLTIPITHPHSTPPNPPSTSPANT